MAHSGRRREITCALELYAHMRQLACGFYYQWVWPIVDGVKKKNQSWIDARKEWHVFCRETIRYSRTYDSPLAVANGINKGEIKQRGEYDDWLSVRDEYKPVTEAIWLSDFLLEDVVVESRKDPTLIWIEHKAVGNRLPEYGVTYFGGGVSEKDILAKKGSTIALSIKAHMTGKNLQSGWHRNMVVSPPALGDVWEQMLGRTHRQGQEHDVDCLVYLHSDAALASFEAARKSAKYMQDTMGNLQKLLLADIIL